MDKPTVGQKLILKIEFSPHGRCTKYRHCEVTYVGRAYFKINGGYSNTRFRIEDWKEDSQYSASYKLYNSIEEIVNEETRERYYKAIVYKLCRTPQYYLGTVDNTPLDSLRKICNLLDIDLTECDKVIAEFRVNVINSIES